MKRVTVQFLGGCILILLLITLFVLPVQARIPHFPIFFPVLVKPMPLPTFTNTPLPTQTFTATLTPPPTATATVTPFPTQPPSATPFVGPILPGTLLHFKGAKGVPLSGTTVKSEFLSSITPHTGAPLSAQGIFLVVIMDVKNSGLTSDSVSLVNSFKVQDDANRAFDLAETKVQTAAKDQYNLRGATDSIQPGFTTRMVFVFDVLPTSQGLSLIAISSW